MTGANFKAEIHPCAMHIEWDPTMEEGTILYEFAEFLNIDGNLEGSVINKKSFLQKKRWLGINEKTISITDPVTGADLSNVSVAGAMKILVELFDQLHEEKATGGGPKGPQGPQT